MCPTTMAAVGSAVSSMSTATMFAASLGVSALSTGVNYIAQQQNQAAQIEAQERNMQAQSEAATRSMVQSTVDLQQRELQERASTAMRVENARQRTDEAKATANATAGGTGLSFDALLSDYERDYDSYASAQYQQLGFNVDQIGRQREAIEAKAQGRINSMPRTPVAGPSLGGALADFGSAAVSSYGQFATRDPLTGNMTL